VFLFPIQKSTPVVVRADGHVDTVGRSVPAVDRSVVQSASAAAY
jgi:hypothetical protein